jgi:thioredoxin-related protein
MMSNMWQRLLLTTLAIGLLAAYGIGAENGKGTDQSDGAENADSIAWLRFDDGMLRLKASEEEKHILVNLTASWCGWCRRMDKEAFSDQAVVAMVNEHFIPVQVWGDSDKMLDINGYRISEKNFAVSEFRNTGFPAFWFITPKQVKVGPLRGYQTPERMLAALNWIKDVKYDTTQVKSGSTKKDSEK